jgi:hypothetical protein
MQRGSHDNLCLVKVFDRKPCGEIERGRVLDYCDFHYGDEFAEFERSFLDELPVDLQESIGLSRGIWCLVLVEKGTVRDT